MDLNFIQGLAGNDNQVASSDNTMNYVVMKTPDGDITFTYDGDDRLEGAFKDYEKLGKITQKQHSTLLNTMNSCEWDLKVDFINGEFTKVERYTPEEYEIQLKLREEAEHKAFYESERALAVRILEDNLLGFVSDEDAKEVKLYIKAISNPKARPTIVRPEIMKRYEVI